jgi:hypothetical protein
LVFFEEFADFLAPALGFACASFAKARTPQKAATPQEMQNRKLSLLTRPIGPMYFAFLPVDVRNSEYIGILPETGAIQGRIETIQEENPAVA